MEPKALLKELNGGDDNDNIPRGIYVKFDNPSIGRTLRNATDHIYTEAILI